MIDFIYPNEIARPGGHYSPGVKIGNILYVSGQLPIDAAGQKITGTLQQQTEQVLQNVEAVVKAAGGDRSNIVKMTIYITDVEKWTELNEYYSEFFGEHRPARVVVPVPNLHYGFALEMEAIAALED